MRRPEVKVRLDFTKDMPKKFRTDYKLGNYDPDRIQKIMWKYLVRSVNSERAWVRLNHHTPELLSGREKMKILEVSTAHGAMLDILRHYGHEVRGTDFNWVSKAQWDRKIPLTRPWFKEILDNVSSKSHRNLCNDDIVGWPYQPIIESLDLNVDIFDGGTLPYHYEDKSFDYLYCYQAIDAFGPADKWIDYITEFCRIARKAVVVGFNPLPHENRNEDKDIQLAVDSWKRMQSLTAHSLKTVYFEIGTTGAGIHPVGMKMMAV